MSNKFLKELGKKEILTPHVDRWFTRNQPKVDPFQIEIQLVKEPDSYFHPSSHVVGCARTIYAGSFDPAFKDMPGRTFNKKVGANGHLWHALLGHVVVNELGFAESAELPVWAYPGTEKVHAYPVAPELWEASKRNRWIAKGTLDLSPVTVPGYDEKFVVDFKTMNPDSYGLEYPPAYLWHKYVAQMQLYMDWTGCKRAILFCIKAANPFDFKEIVIDYDPEAVKYIYSKWDSIHEAVMTDTPPEHTCVDPVSCSSNEFYVGSDDDERQGVRT